jgi:hypothetical protein
MIKHQTIVSTTYDNLPSNADIITMAETHDKRVQKFLEEHGLDKKDQIAKISTTPYPAVIFTTITWIKLEIEETYYITADDDNDDENWQTIFEGTREACFNYLLESEFSKPVFLTKTKPQ